MAPHTAATAAITAAAPAAITGTQTLTGTPVAVFPADNPWVTVVKPTVATVLEIAIAIP
jgi:hypothetical protein